MSRIVVFLDFDGVLHPVPSGQNGIFYHLPRFETVMRDHPDIDVVISSSWREIYPWDVIQEIFSRDMRSRIIGMTPVLLSANRYEEIQAWISARQYEGKWLAIDDDKEAFPEMCEQLLLCESMSGFDETAERRLVGLITNLHV